MLCLLLGNKNLPTKPRHKHKPQTGHYKKKHSNLVSRDKIAHKVLIATENSVFYIAKY